MTPPPPHQLPTPLPPHFVARYHGDGVLSLCELHQDDEHRGENKLPAHFRVEGMSVSGATAGAWSLAAYGIANEDALPADVAATLIELKSKGRMKSLLSEAAMEIK